MDSAFIDITHEALLAAWPRLRRWIDADRAGLLVLRCLTESAAAWQDVNRDAASLLRGGRLAMARDWAADPEHSAALSPLEREYLDASVAQEAAEQRTARRSARRLRALVAALTVFLMLAVGLAGVAFRQRQQARVARDQADSRETAVEADQLRGWDVSVAAQLGIAAYRIYPTPQALSSLLESSGTPAATRLLGPAGVVQALAVSSQHVLAVASTDGAVRLWNIWRPQQPVLLGPPLVRLSTPLYAARTAPTDGSWRPRGPTAPSGCGTSPRRVARCRSAPRRAAPQARSTRWRSAPAAGPWPLAAPTTPCSCGMSATRGGWPRPPS